MSFRSIPAIDASDSPHIGKRNFSSINSFHSYRFVEDPSARVQFLLGDEDQDDDDEEHKPHDLFIELDELVTTGDKSTDTGDNVEQGWKETARSTSEILPDRYSIPRSFRCRWVKFEEDVETGGRWSKPHVATLSLHSLLELRNFISRGSIILDMHADQLPTIVGEKETSLVPWVSMEFSRYNVG